MEPASTRLSGRGRSRAFGAGARAMAPLLLGIAPYGMVVGVTIASSGLATVVGLSTGWFIYSGAAQIAVIQSFGTGAAPVLVVVTVVVLNARLLVYGAGMAGPWRQTGRGWRALAAYLLVDPSFAVGVDGYERRGATPAGHAHYLGGAVVLWLTWQLATLAGVTVGSVLPQALAVEFVVPLYLVAVVVPKATTRRLRIVVAVAAGTAVVGAALPFHLGPTAAVAAGLLVGLRGERR